MKHLKQFEMWTTNTTSDFNINYGNTEPELSQTVIDTIKFINDNFDNITNIGSSNITFKYRLEIEDINLHNEKPIYYIRFTYRDIRNNLLGYQDDISKKEYDFLSNFIIDTYKRYRRKN